jgi:pyridoxine 5-phosphate synthase
VSLFIDPDPRQVEAASRVGAPVVEFHTGTYCEAPAGAARSSELKRLRRVATLAHGLGIECHAGHGLSYGTARPVAAIPEVVELNIGHFLVGEAVFIGWVEAIRRMREVMDAGRRDLAWPDYP